MEIDRHSSVSVLCWNKVRPIIYVKISDFKGADEHNTCGHRVCISFEYMAIIFSLSIFGCLNIFMEIKLREIIK